MLLTEVIFVANVATANHGKFPLASDFFSDKAKFTHSYVHCISMMIMILLG